MQNFEILRNIVVICRHHKKFGHNDMLLYRYHLFAQTEQSFMSWQSSFRNVRIRTNKTSNGIKMIMKEKNSKSSFKK